MVYIIDANNLAGKLDLLDIDNFDNILIPIINNYFESKKIKIILVFDSADRMGDKIIFENFEIIYTPRDGFYNGADDKILELIGNYLKDNNFKEEIILITDDIDLGNKVKRKKEESDVGYRIKLMKASFFALKIINQEEVKNLQEKEDWEKSDADNLNKELLRAWKK